MPGAEPKKYQQRRPEKTVLYRVIQQHLESFLQHAHESSGKRLPKYVENEFRRYLECGLHAHGFARAVCESYGDELLLPFSCKLRFIQEIQRWQRQQARALGFERAEGAAVSMSATTSGSETRER